MPYCVVRPDAKIGPTTQTGVRVGPKRPKTDRNPSGSREDKPFLVASRPTAKPACDYTKWPEVKALPATPSNPAEVVSAAAREGDHRRIPAPARRVLAVRRDPPVEPKLASYLDRVPGLR
jgi:hypothetical protein